MIFTNRHQPELVVEGTPYTKCHGKANKTLQVDARGDRIYLMMEEYDLETNRTKAVSMLVSREEWENFKNINAKEWGVF
jgi:hypothetical protein